jgi:signal transduction histidine kinase/ligand-binding sensor domain-containing protein
MCFEHLRRFIYTAIIALAPLIVQAQEPRYRIETISTQDGLSPTKASSIIQDRYGFIWIASPEGLDRYDGYSFRSYRHNPLDTTSLSSQEVWAVAEDSSGNIWAGGLQGGLNRLDRRTGRFTHFQHNPHDTLSMQYNIRSICADRLGLWIRTNDGLYRFTIRTGRFRRVGRAAWAGLPAGAKVSVYVDHAGVTWIVTLANDDNSVLNAAKSDTCTVFLSRSDQSGESFTTWPISTRGGIMRIEGERNGMPFLTYDRIDTSAKALIYLFDPVSGRLAPFDIPSRQSNRNERLTYYAGEVDGDYCWYAAQGINNSLTLHRERLIPFETMRSGELGRMARAVVARQPILSYHEGDYSGSLRDRSGAYWLTTENGIVRVIPIDSGIHIWRASMDHLNNRDNPATLSWRILTTVLVDRQGILWVGTTVGLNRYEAATGHWHKYFHNPRQPGTLPADYIRAIYEDHDGTLLFTTDKGLVAYDRQKDNFYKPYNPIRWPVPDNAFYTSLLRDRRKRLWIGTSAGILRLDSMGRVEQWFTYDSTDPGTLSAGPVWYLLEDRRGEIWVGTDNGLCRWIPKNEGFRRYPVYVVGLCEDGGGDVWICRKDTIGHYNRERDTFTTIVPVGLASTSFIDLFEDDSGNFWLGSMRGLVRWDRRTNTFRRFDEHDGLLGDRFINGLFKASDGTLYFGSDKGLNAFNPAVFRDNPVPPLLAITGFHLFDSLIAGQLFDGDTIRLDHTQNFFSFEFAGLDYGVTGRNSYAYILEGLDPEWVHTGSEHRIAGYTDLAPGLYTFRLRGANRDGVWNQRGLTITIIIAPPWWQTWWFRVAVAVAAVGLAVTAFRLRTNSIRRNEQEKRELAVQAALEMQETERQRIARDLHDGVGQMLAAAKINMARLREMIGRNGSAPHNAVELQAPLDLAMGIIGRAGSDVRTLSHALGSSTVREAGLVAALRELLASIEAQEKTTFEFVAMGMDERLSAPVEIGLFRVAQELIANVLHHASASEATVQIMREPQLIRLIVEDNGRGFDPMTTNGGGMGRHNITARVAAMGGQLYYDSTPGHGTTVTVVVKEEER